MPPTTKNSAAKSTASTLKATTINAALAQMQDYTKNRSYLGLPQGKTCAAFVIFKSNAGPLKRTMYIDRGTLDGVHEGMPVAAGGALVGIVNAAGPTMSEVILLGDPRLKIRAIVVQAKQEQANPPSGDLIAGILVGTGRAGKPMRMDYISRRVPVAEGDYAVTSGQDARFPRGLLAGRVSAVKDSSDSLHHAIDVQPPFDFDELDQVLVLIEWPKEMPPP